MNEKQNPETSQYHLQEPEQRCRDEYKALRDEMVMLFNRTFVIFAAEVTAGFTLAWRMIESETVIGVLLIAMAAQIILAIGLLISLHLYNHIYNIGSYILVFLEGNAGGWTLRSRHLQIPSKRTDNPSQFNLSFELKKYEKLNEPKTIGRCYLCLILIFSLFLPLLWPIVLRFQTPLFQPKPEGLSIMISVLIAGVISVLIAVVAFYNYMLYRDLMTVYSTGARRAMKKWYEYQQSVLDKAENQSQKPADFMFNELLKSLNELERKNEGKD